MTWLRRLPARLRLTLAFAVAMIALLTGAGAGLYTAVGAVLLDELDTGLRARAATVQADLAAPGFKLVAPPPALLERTEEFVQILGRDGAVLDTSPGITGDTLPTGTAATLTAPHLFQRTVTGVVGTARILAVPTRKGSTPVILVVGASMSDRGDALHRFAVYLSVGGPAAVLLASAVGWLLTGAALRPIERMRCQASAITASDLDRRLSLPAAHDEFRRLAETLNDMLARLDASMATERRFLDNASHELRTPLTALKTELDLALARPRTPQELLAALHGASEEADRLTRMAEDLLILARTQGRLPVLRTPVSLSELLTASARLFQARADAAGVCIQVVAADRTVNLDPARVRQAVDNLLDNALRYAPSGTAISVSADVSQHVACIRVDDHGPGMPPALRDRLFDPFVRVPEVGENGQHQGSGLGLAIVAAIAAGHGGTVTIESRTSNGTRAELRLPEAWT